METHLPHTDKGLSTEAEEAVFQENLSIRSRNNLSLIISDTLIKQARTVPRDNVWKEICFEGAECLIIITFLVIFGWTSDKKANWVTKVLVHLGNKQSLQESNLSALMKGENIKQSPLPLSWPQALGAASRRKSESKGAIWLITSQQQGYSNHPAHALGNIGSGITLTLQLGEWMLAFYFGKQEGTN